VIDLHTHTNESDGTCAPLELIDRAMAIGLEALAICDHDTFAGYDQAAPAAKSAGLDLVCGIELSTRLSAERTRDVHLLGYFLHRPPAREFCDWLGGLQAGRRDRNRRLVARLQARGVEIELEEVERMGRSLTGRPHFARVLVHKGYAANSEEAFQKYLDESAPSFVERHAPPVTEGIRRVAEGGGLPVLAHPIRLGIRDPAAEEALIGELRDAGLRGLEAYHSDHRPWDAERYAAVARKLGLAVTGGSDFHGSAKPRISLGTGFDGNLSVPLSVLDELRKL